MAVSNSALIPTTRIYDIESLEIDNPGLKEFLVQLYQTVNLLSVTVNQKDTGYYTLDEFVNSQYFFPNTIAPGNYEDSATDFRTVYRTVVNFGALPNAGTKAVPHNIQGIGANTTFSFTRIYATATDPAAPSFIPIPFASTIAVANNIALFVDQTNVNITTGLNRSNYTICYVVLEYLRGNQ